jgi:hypothetical protein
VLVVTVTLLAIGAVIVQQVGMMGASLPSIRTPSPPRSKRWIS